MTDDNRPQIENGFAAVKGFFISSAFWFVLAGAGGLFLASVYGGARLLFL